MALGYLGGLWPHGQGRPPLEAAWFCPGGGGDLALRVEGFRLFTWDGLALLLRGYVRPSGSSGPLDPERVAAGLRCRYLETGRLAVDGLEGSFTLALLDGGARRVLLYRNLVGSGFTYYHARGNGFVFGSRLADLVSASGAEPLPNRDALPTFFLSRCVPGRDTLFDGFCRLLPGEEITWDANHGLVRLQRHTFADLAATPPRPAEALDALDEVTGRILADCAAHRPGACNLLSGGVDSSYLQAVWNRVAVTPELPVSFSVSVDHPRTWADTDYAVTAAAALGCRHTLIPADAPYPDYLADVLATGEPPNHVQTAYFGHLARAMKARGVPAGLCGEGADSLFGLGLANQIHNAAVARRLAPLRPLRRAAAAVAGLLGLGRVATTFRLADNLDVLTHPEHPVNRAAVFADLDAVKACFGRAALAEAAAARRALLDRFAVPDDPMQRLHAIGFLNEAMDSASLWATLFHDAGADLLCPFLDSRMLRFALNLPPALRFPFRRPKDLLKRALARAMPPDMAHRPKLGFGQPVFEWLGPDGCLRPLVDALDDHPFVDAATLERSRRQPNWFLYSLLCYDLWHRRFIDGAASGRQPAAEGRRAVA
jgi:asparagine synthase (glutamine-hydrolysing)